MNGFSLQTNFWIALKLAYELESASEEVLPSTLRELGDLCYRVATEREAADV